MLQNLHIKNIALIDEIDISFEDRLNILTGETGAGKSIIIGSLGICLGGRFHKDLLRDEGLDGIVELTFTVDNKECKKELDMLGIDTSDGEILISRKVNASGKTVSRINGETVTTAALKKISGLLINLHAQHEQQTLLKEESHLAILDSYGCDDILKLKKEVRDSYEEFSRLESELEALRQDEADREKKIDFLKFQIDEIEAAKLKEGEEEELFSYYKKASNSKDILAEANDIYREIGGASDSATERIGRSVSTLKRLAELDDDLSDSYEALQNIDEMLSDFNRDFKDYMNSMEFDEKEFVSVEARLNLVSSLKTKYGKSIEEINKNKKDFEAEYERLTKYDEYVLELETKLGKAEGKLKKVSEALSALRKKNAKSLCEIIKASLEELNFDKVLFEMKFEELKAYTPNGKDSACFMISTNVGEEMRPLYQVASGGELSRVMLAIKSCLAATDDTPTLVFDEIDVGISGRTAQKVAEKLSMIAKAHQVICITHLPQIAAMSDAHYLIEKNVENNKTITNIKKLDADSEIEEIARLLSGAKITEASLNSAKDMKGLASQAKLY